MLAMRLFATFLCFFLLLLVFGTLSYVYLLWRHYLIRVEKLQEEYERHEYHHGGAMRARHSEGRRKEDNDSSAMTYSTIPDDKLMEHVEHYETQVVY